MGMQIRSTSIRRHSLGDAMEEEVHGVGSVWSLPRVEGWRWLGVESGHFLSFVQLPLARCWLGFESGHFLAFVELPVCIHEKIPLFSHRHRVAMS